MVYRFLYYSPEEGHHLTPDIYGTRYYLENPLGRTKQPTPIMTVRRSGTGLLRTCKQVNVEATDILYGVNTFAFAETMHPIRANASLDFLENRKLVRRLAVYGGMSDLLQMKDFFNLIGASNLAKIRHIKIEIDVLSVFLGYVPTPSLFTGYPGISGPGRNVICDAINMLAGAGGSLASFEVSRSRNLIQHSHIFEFAFISPRRLNSDDHTEQYPSYRMFEASGSHGIDAPLGRSIRSLKGVKLICKDMDLLDHEKCDKSDQCRICMQIKGFKIMQKEMLKDSVSCSLTLEMLD